MLRNWAGNVTYTATRLHRPRTVEELQHLVATTPRIRALGTRHSFSRVADTDGDLVTVADIDVPIGIDADARTVEVGAGIRYGELAPVLDDAGWALPNLGSLPHISVAGACATGTHGSGDTLRCLATGAVAAQYVRADGELVTVTRDDPEFGGSVLALGALGVLTRLTLELVPAFELRQDVWLDAPLDTVLERFDEITSSGYSVSAFLSYDRPGIVDQLWVKSRPDREPVDGRAWGARAAEAAVHPVAGADTAAATEQLGVPGRWHARLPHFRLEYMPSAGEEQQTEYLLPREHGPAALAALQALDLRAALQVSEIRTIAADDLWLSPTHDRDSVAVHFTWVDDDVLVQPAVAAVEAALAPFEPRPHWGKVFRTDPDTVRAQYPKLPEFTALAARQDPEHRFGNAFLERFVY
jgi:xylitol oxidase